MCVITFLFLLYIARRYNVKLLLQKNTFCKICRKTPAPESLFLIKFDAFMPETCNFFKKETLELVFSCKFCYFFHSSTSKQFIGCLGAFIAISFSYVF